MGLRFRKSVRIGKRGRINLSRSGIGYSYGVKGLRWTKKATGGTRTTLSIPGTGISYVSESTQSAKRKKTSLLLWILIIAFWPIALCVWFVKNDKIDASKSVRFGVIAAFIAAIVIGGVVPMWQQIADDRAYTQALEAKGIHIPTEEEFAASHRNLPAPPVIQQIDSELPEQIESTEPVTRIVPASEEDTEEQTVVEQTDVAQTVIVYVTASGEKYHKENCRTIKSSDKIAKTIEEAVMQGYEPCGVCNPK